MCGIAGVAGNIDPVGAEQLVRSMTASLARRGPDAEGLHSWQGAVFGHRRLAIFDLSPAGRQPMLSPDGAVGVVFNGAIYNFLEIREQLAAAGYSFCSRTDTEVLIHGYRHWGFDGMVQRLRGMFAIALWDQDARKLFLIRDRLGVKPLVYTQVGNVLAFASTVRALRQAGLAGEIDDQAVLEYLEFGYVTDARTIYRNVYKVPAATIVEWSENGIRQREYWQPAAASHVAVKSFDDLVEETEQRFLEAVRIRMEADVPVGALLSGGVDSSLVCWAIRKLGGKIRAFTVSTPGDVMDETADAVATARLLEIDHEVIPVSSQETPSVKEMVEAFGEPFACASALGLLAVSKAVKPHATVLLTGDGGDDVFLGYPEHKNFWMAERLANQIPRALAGLWPVLRRPLPPAGPLRRAQHFLDYSTGGLGAVIAAHDGLPGYGDMLGERLAGKTVAQRETQWSLASARSLSDDFLAYDRKTRFVGEYLTKVDGATMHYALEARSPFLDQELWNFAAALPVETRLHRGTLKALLREIAARRIGPRVAGGAKRGFGVPVQRWLANGWQPGFEALFRESLLDSEGYVRAGTVLQRIRRESRAGQVSKQFWYLFVLESWLRHEKSL